MKRPRESQPWPGRKVNRPTGDNPHRVPKPRQWPLPVPKNPPKPSLRKPQEGVRVNGP